MLGLATEVRQLLGIGDITAERLEKLGIRSVRDLLFYFPRRWNDYSHPQMIKKLRVGDVAIIRGSVAQIRNDKTFRKRMAITSALLVDDGASIRAIWFNQPFLLKTLRLGSEWIFTGKVDRDPRLNSLYINSPTFEQEAGILPVYSETEGITSKQLRRIVKPLLRFAETISEYLPDELLEREKLILLPEALKAIHFPSDTMELQKAKERLAFDEFFFMALRTLQAKAAIKQYTGPKMILDEKLLQRFVKSLPYELTNAQRKAAWEILKDLEKPIPMNRLLEGEVGSGKTVVAAMAVLTSAKNTYQSVWLAPTEILAFQHYRTVTKLLQPFGVSTAILTGSKKEPYQNRDLVIGTHALLEEHIHIPRLGLLIVDEQHRFGVKQRSQLRERPDLMPHLLSMTATPIPRTLALALYGDLDLSIIDELPKSRKKVETQTVDPEHREEAYEFIRRQINDGRQAFVITPIIGNGQNANGRQKTLFDPERKSAIEEYDKLSKTVFPDLRIGLLHGRLGAKEKEKVMRDFSDHRLDLLVSTAVVEVGIDVPNATVMMIEGAERFGLAQLHQFRGRVGRGEHQAYCFLFPTTADAKESRRLRALEQTDNGFELAEKDLEIRGPGELVGFRQSGLPDLKMASLADTALLKRARGAAEWILDQHLDRSPKLAGELHQFAATRHLE